MPFLPEVERDPADPRDGGRAAYTIRSKKFVFFRGPRKDAADPGRQFFTTSHWDGYNAVLLLERDLGPLTVAEVREIVTDAWLAGAPRRLAK